METVKLPQSVINLQKYLKCSSDNLLKLLKEGSNKPMKIKDLHDSAKFTLTQNKKPVVWELQSLDHKKKMATITAVKSKTTRVVGWGKTVWPV